MSWASRRRVIIVSIVGVIVVAFLAVISFAVLYKAPSCSDGIQNQGEAGIDCGGPCQYLCTEQMHAPVVLYTKVFTRSDGGVDVIASVQNTNSAAVKNAPYTIALYDVNHILIQNVTGTLDLPPVSTVPVFIPHIMSTSGQATQAFLSIDAQALHWITYTGSRSVPVVSNTNLSGSTDSPRIDAGLTNTTATTFSMVRVVVIVQDAQGQIIAASQTVVPSIPAQGQATATFTWNTPFPGTPVNIEVIPIIPLP